MDSSSSHLFEGRFDDAWPVSFWCDLHVVLAVSGGADSVAMLRATHALKGRRGGMGRLYIAHLNHGLRRDEADADAEWLQALCRDLVLPLEVGKCDVAAIAERHGDGWEAAARSARYEFLQRTAEKFGARVVAVAHTADDQVETVLHRIIRGTGIAGLAGMKVVRPLSPSVALVRPMLALRRAEVVAYLASLGQDFRADSSNEDLRFTRNRLRNELLPALRQYYNADVDDAILRLAEQAAESQRLVENKASAIASNSIVLEYARAGHGSESTKAVGARINCESLAHQPDLIIREVCKVAWREAGWPLQAMGFDKWQQLASMARCEGQLSTVNFPGDVRAQRSGQYLRLQSTGLG
jgi:tRNA(Ile)-lysidine synthase